MEQLLRINHEETVRLCLNSKSPDVNATIRGLHETKNLCLKKLSFVNFEKRFDFASLSTIPNIRESLRTLTLRYGHIFPGAALHIANFITGSSLKKITLANHKVNADSGGLVITINSIALAPIRKLKLCRLCIQKSEAEGIVRALENAPLIKLSLIGCTFRDGALALIIGAIKTSNLLTLKLESARNMNREEMMALIDCVERSKLIKLSLRSTDFAFGVLPITLAASIQKSTIRTLNVLHSPLFIRVADIVGAIQNSHSCITKFKFDQLTFSAKNKIEIMNAIKGNTAFRNISFARAPLTDQLFTNICDLVEHSSATCLDLSCCYLSGEQMSTVIDRVKRSSISSLNLSRNCFNDQAVVSICDLLENYNLRKINIDGITHEMLLVILPSINRSELTKFVRCSYAYCYDSKWNKTQDDNMWANIKKFTTEQKNILKTSRKMKSARHI